MLGEDFIEALDKETELIYLASPNNPTGQLIPPEILKGILKRCQELDIIVVVDECFRNGTYRYLLRWQDALQQKKRNLSGKAENSSKSSGVF